MHDYTLSPLPKTNSSPKTLFRSNALKRLRSINKSKKILFDHVIKKILIKKIKERKAKSVMLYIPLDNEADMMPLIAWLRRRDIRVYVPFMEGESFRLVQYRLPLDKKKYGVKEPRFSNKYRKKMIDLAIVPIVGTDPTGRRIGFGKGMYDRFFAVYGKDIKYTIFVQRVLQLSETIITDNWDISADEIVAAA